MNRPNAAKINTTVLIIGSISLLMFFSCIGKEKSIRTYLPRGLDKKSVEGFVFCIPFTVDREGLPFPVFFYISKNVVSYPTLMEKELSSYFTHLVLEERVIEQELCYDFSLSHASMNGTCPENKIADRYATDQAFRNRLKTLLEAKSAFASSFSRMVYHDDLFGLLSAMNEGLSFLSDARRVKELRDRHLVLQSAPRPDSLSIS
jgi:hypothetical protein